MGQQAGNEHFPITAYSFLGGKKSETRLDFLFDFSDKASTAAQRKRGEVRRGEVELSCPAAHDEIEQWIQIRTWQEIRAQIARAITRVDVQIAN